MRVVSENSETDLARRQASQAARAAIRELAANLMRLVAGAGKPYAIERQALDLVEAYRAFWETQPNFALGEDLARDLDLTEDLFALKLSETEAEWLYANRSIREGALRMAAAELLGQRVHVAHGRHRVMEGIAAIEKIRTKNRDRARQTTKPKSRKIPPSSPAKK